MKAVGALSLVELRTRFPALFYPQQWFLDEPFTRTLPNELHLTPPTGVAQPGTVPRSSKGLPLACELALAYVRDPLHHAWRSYVFWCRDVDRYGQRVYVTDNGKGLEIHRLLEPNERYGVPSW